MIEKIYIPTVKRVDNQITYNNLPSKLKDKVVFVVQTWERNQYKYDAEYLVLPDTEEYHYSHYYCLPKTRQLIYEAGKNIKYAILDDDLRFARRNLKYFGYPSNMEKSKRYCTDDDILEMFELYNTWLDEVTVCGCAMAENPPSGRRFRNNTSLAGALWINGQIFKDILPTLDLTCVRVAEDVCFLLNLLSRGYKNRVSDEFCFVSDSKRKSIVWDNQSLEQTHTDHKIMEEKFPGIFNILYDENGNRLAGGYKNHGKVKIHWNKAFKKSLSLNKFFV